MDLPTLAAFAHTPHLIASLAITRDTRTLTRLCFLYAAVETGLLKHLKEALAADVLAERMQAKRADLLHALLELGVTLGELSCADGRYALNGRRARALAEESSGPLPPWCRNISRTTYLYTAALRV